MGVRARGRLHGQIVVLAELVPIVGPDSPVGIAPVSSLLGQAGSMADGRVAGEGITKKRKVGGCVRERAG